MFRAVRSRLWELWDAGNDFKNYGRSIRTALDDLYELVDEIAAKTLDDHQTVSEVMASWRAEIYMTATGRRTKPKAQGLLAELYELAKEAVHHDPFKELLDQVAAKTSAIYGTWWRDVSLSLGYTREHPRPPGSDSNGIGAATKLDDDRAEIQLDIYATDFGPAAYAALPYVLIHECVCHVPARQDKNDNRSEFAEGFLDWAAVYFFERWIAELDSCLAPAAIEHTARLGGILKRETSPTGVQRLRGHHKAQLLATWFQDSGISGCRDQARAKVASLAIELNETDTSLARKDWFLSTVRFPLPSELQEGLRAWASGEKSAEDLLWGRITLGPHGDRT
jgi:hypothetical protein